MSGDTEHRLIASVQTLIEAASAIEKLRTENERLRAALKPFSDEDRDCLLAEVERLRTALGWMLALHDDQPSYDKGSTIAAARRVHGGGQ